MRLILASASPRRAELLTAAGFTFETLVVDVDETPQPAESPERYVRRLAAEKSARALEMVSRSAPVSAAGDGGKAFLARPSAEHADAAFERDGNPVVLGADTTVTIDGAILAKPDDAAHAREMLRRLSGRTHQVLTGISLRQGAYELGRVETTDVEFAPMTDADIEWYVATGEGRDKAGGYAIQGYASRFIPRISGSYSNVVGLPVAAVWELLRQLEPAEQRLQRRER